MHNLIAPPGVKIGTSCWVYSHPVALAQQRFFAARRAVGGGPGLRPAGSVKMIVESGKREEAAIAGKSAAEAYAAEILRRGREQLPELYPLLPAGAARPGGH